MSIYTQVQVKYCNVFIYLYAMLLLGKDQSDHDFKSLKMSKKLGMTLDN